jgi:hypothetical protein
MRDAKRSKRSAKRHVTYKRPLNPLSPAPKWLTERYGVTSSFSLLSVLDLGVSSEGIKILYLFGLISVPHECTKKIG